MLTSLGFLCRYFNVTGVLSGEQRLGQSAPFPGILTILICGFLLPLLLLFKIDPERMWHEELPALCWCQSGLDFPVWSGLPSVGQSQQGQELMRGWGS